MVGISYDFHVQIGSQKKRQHVMAMILNDFNIILNTNFLQSSKVSIIPHLNGIFIQSEKHPCFIPYNARHQMTKEQDSKQTNIALISTTTLCKGLRYGRGTFLATFIGVGLDYNIDNPNPMITIIKEYANMMLPYLSQWCFRLTCY